MTVSSLTRVLPTTADLTVTRRQLTVGWMCQQGSKPIRRRSVISHESAMTMTMTHSEKSHIRRVGGSHENIVLRYTGNDTEWSAMHGAFSTNGAMERRRGLLKRGVGGVRLRLTSLFPTLQIVIPQGVSVLVTSTVAGSRKPSQPTPRFE